MKLFIIAHAYVDIVCKNNEVFINLIAGKMNQVKLKSNKKLKNILKRTTFSKLNLNIQHICRTLSIVST